ncbi:MAG: Holliday junction branch migration protein RuvA [Chloroflexi bacterium]|nr:Holliday junction branch migration protein RuvA [Chloroflexota bacterium]
MITSIRGTLEAIGADWIVVRLGGISLQVHVPGSSIEELGHLGTTVQLFTYLRVREDELSLFGFTSEHARQLFELFLGVNGVGPRLALNILSSFTPESLAAAISSSDVEAFDHVPGVGKKMASRLVLELRGKLKKEWTLVSETSSQGEVVAALVALGYTSAEARSAVFAMDKESDLPLEERVREALQRLAPG